MTLAAVFMGFLTLHVLHNLATNWRGGDRTDLSHDRPKPYMLLSQTPMFLIACYLAYQQGVFSRALLSPLYFAAGLAAGFLIFCASVYIVHATYKAAVEMFTHGLRLARFTLDCPAVLSRFITVAFAEELIYRAVAQPILIAWTGSAVLGIGILAVVFSIVHHHFFRNSWRVSGEFLVFSTALGTLYYLTGSLLLVIVIHAVRDIAIAYLEFEGRLEDGADWESAADAIDSEYGPRRNLRTAAHAGAGVAA